MLVGLKCYLVLGAWLPFVINPSIIPFDKGTAKEKKAPADKDKEKESAALAAAKKKAADLGGIFMESERPVGCTE